MITHPLLAVGILLILGWAGGRAANALGLPRVTGYLIAGLMLGPSLFHVLPHHLIQKKLSAITEMALSIIAYTIGGSLVYDRLKRLGGNILWITGTQALGTFLLTTILLIPVMIFLPDVAGAGSHFWRTFLPLPLIIGAISVATAPGTVLAIISELKASGPFTTILLGVIAINDGLAIVFFALAEAGARALLNPLSPSWLSLLGGAGVEISLSLALGLSAGLLLQLIARLIRRREAFLTVILGIIAGVTGLASQYQLSPLLANMVVGFFIVNWERGRHEFFSVVEQIEEPLYGLFFALAGAHLDIGNLKSAGLLAVAILFSRFLGKQTGAWTGALISQASTPVRKYLFLGLLPQAGVSIGLVLIAQEIFPVPAMASILVNGVIGAVILSELIGPPLVKQAFIKAGECRRG